MNRSQIDCFNKCESHLQREENSIANIPNSSTSYSERSSINQNFNELSQNVSGNHDEPRSSINSETVNLDQCSESPSNSDTGTIKKYVCPYCLKYLHPNHHQVLMNMNINIERTMTITLGIDVEIFMITTKIVVIAQRNSVSYMNIFERFTLHYHFNVIT